MQRRILIIVILVFSMTHILAQAQETINRYGDFEDDRSGLEVKHYNDAHQSNWITSEQPLSGEKSLVIEIDKGGSAAEDIIASTVFELETGRFYTLSFMARASKTISIQALFQERYDDKRIVWSAGDLVFNDTAAELGPFEFHCMEPDMYAQLLLYLGGMDDVTITLDDIVVTMEDDPDHLRMEEKFEKREYSNGEITIPYRFAKPDGYQAGQYYPMVLGLHGASHRGNDNERQLTIVSTIWAEDDHQAQWPCFVLSPQCPSGGSWANFSNTGMAENIGPELGAVSEIMNSLIEEFAVDTNRIYITGHSMGGFGTFDMISRFPHRFAAAIPLAGGGDPSLVERYNHLPVWIFHGETDGVVEVSWSRNMVVAMENEERHVVYTDCNFGDCTGMDDAQVQAAIEAGADLLYTEFQDGPHGISSQTYNFPNLLPWVFSWSKTGKISSIPDLQKRTSTFSLKANYPNPFNPSTQIEYELAYDRQVKVEILNERGQLVQILVDTHQSAGRYHLPFHTGSLPSGSYYARILIQGEMQSIKMILVK